MYIIVEIIAAMLSFLALATKEMRRGRIGNSAPPKIHGFLAHLWSAKCVKKLIGNKDVEEALQKLDRLTQEVARMAAAELMKITYAVDDIVGVVDERVQGVDRVRDIHDGIQGANRKVVRASCSSHPLILTLVIGLKTHELSTANQLRDNFQTWLSPPNPSINHNIACKAHHKGTAQWFLGGSIFNEWKATGSLLWIHGKRVSLLTHTTPLPH